MMKRTDFIQNDVFGVPATFRKYDAPVFNGCALVMYHGAGETGPLDGSELNEVEKHGYPKHAKAGHDFPFDIIAIQVASSFDSVNRYFLEWLKVRFGYTKIVITGLSRGGQAVHNLTMKDLTYVDKLYVGAVAIAGRPDTYATADPATVKDLPMISIHGEKDNIVPYSQDKVWCERVNAVPGRKNLIDFISLPNVAHEGWTLAYSLDTTNPITKKVYDFIHNLLKPDVIVDRYEEGYSVGYSTGLSAGYTNGVIDGKALTKNLIINTLQNA